MTTCYPGLMKNRVVNVTEFKAKCLAMLTEIGERGGTITITKRGRPIAKVGPPHRPAWKSPEGSLAGKVIFDDAILDADMSDLWDCVRDPEGQI
jgi:antitoxin (DNA-binding transcriptional repressor) of toxin-antitoxin stability system